MLRVDRRGQSVTPGALRRQPRDASATRVRNRGRINPTSGVETGYDFHESWRGDAFPRVIAVSLEQQTPYFALQIMHVLADRLRRNTAS